MENTPDEEEGRRGRWQREASKAADIGLGCGLAAVLLALVAFFIVKLGILALALGLLKVLLSVL